MTKNGRPGGSSAQDNNFALIGSRELGVEISFPQLACICGQENDMRLGLEDRRLIRLVFVWNMIRLSLRLFRSKGVAKAAWTRSRRLTVDIGGRMAGTSEAQVRRP